MDEPIHWWIGRPCGESRGIVVDVLPCGATFLEANIVATDKYVTCVGCIKAMKNQSAPYMGR